MGSQRIRHNGVTHFTRVSLIAQSVKNLSAIQETQVPSLVWEDLLEKGMATPFQYSCLENPMVGGA